MQLCIRGSALGEQIGLRHPGQRIQPRTVQAEGEQPFRVPVDNAAHRRQGAAVQRQRDPLPHRAPAAHAVEHTLPQMEAGLLRGGTAAHRTGIQQGLIPRQTHGPQFEGRLHQPQGPVQPVQGVEAVQQQREQFRTGQTLHRQKLRHLSKIAAQRKFFQILPHPAKFPVHCRLLDGPAPPVLVQHHIGPHQQLTACGDGAPLFPAAPGRGSEPPRLLGEQREDLIRLLVGGLPQDKGLGLQVHETRLLCTAGFRHPAGCLGRPAQRGGPYRKPAVFPAPPGSRPGPGTPLAAQFYKIIPTVLTRPQPALPFCRLSLGWLFSPAAMTGKC